MEGRLGGGGPSKSQPPRKTSGGRSQLKSTVLPVTHPLDLLGVTPPYYSQTLDRNLAAFILALP